jgi:hypothetical protein
MKYISREQYLEFNPQRHLRKMFMSLQPLACWGYEFKPWRWKGLWLSVVSVVCCQVEVCASD